jgi:hypothetical protein
MIIISLEEESPNILWTTVETGGGFDEATVDNNIKWTEVGDRPWLPPVL